MSGYVAGATAIASAIGSGVSAYANNQAMRKQDRIAADSIQAQNRLRDQSQQVVQKTVQSAATDNQKTLNDTAASQKAAYMAALQRAAPTQSSASPSLTGGSKAYAKAVTDAQASNAAFGRDQAGSLAATDAPQLTALKNSMTLGDAATKLGAIQDTSNQTANIARLQEGNVQANPWLQAAGSFISGAGSAYGARRKPAQVGTGTGAGVYADNGLTPGALS